MLSAFEEDNNMFAFIVGTRPEIIKMAPIIRECNKQGIKDLIIHTGQHYSYEMDKVFFEELNLRNPDYALGVGSGTDAEQVGKILVGVENVLINEQPDVVLVEGDTNSVFAGAYAATKIHVEVGHVEAGLRSFDRFMPEEINRILTDHVSDFLFAPTAKSKENLLAEGISANKISITGNTIVDAVHQNLQLAQKRQSVLNELGIEKNNYFLITTHRRENVDNKSRLNGILKGLTELHNEFDVPIIFPMHPRTRNRVAEFNLALDGIAPISPIGFLEFLLLEANAELVITDSGGVQEEACILKVPCITVRNNTERPETIAVHSNLLVGTQPDQILNGAKAMLNTSRNWNNPFGNGDAGERIVSVLTSASKACGVEI
jgi:UDP-N-acetylglucosamine 2-epimerase (non-hydrolysing)